MFYRLLMYYFRLKLLGILLGRIQSSRFVQSRNIKNINLITYGLELFSLFFLKPKKK
jgi:hypothetical protein